MAEDPYDPAVCCYCGSSTYQSVLTGPSVPIISCTTCSLMRQGVLSEDVKNNRAFIDYAGGIERFKRQKFEKELAHTSDFIKISDRLEEYLPDKGRLLEIGCGMGTPLNEFRKKGWEVLGVEPDKWTCEQAKSRYGLNVICAPFQEAGLGKESFDVVLLIHVIEHLSNPFVALRQIYELIRPGGFLVLETPRYDTLMFRILRGRERSVIPEHIHYFTRKSMLAMCKDVGLSARRVEAVGRTVTLDRLSFYLAKFLRVPRLANAITRLSDFLRLNTMSVHINLHDMMRLYLEKTN